jgi:hypothetical protein
VLGLSGCTTSTSPEKQQKLLQQEKRCIGKAQGTASLYFENKGDGNACYEVANFYEYLYYGKEYSKAKKAALQKSLVFYQRGCILNNAKSCGALAFDEIQRQKRTYGSFRANTKFISYAQKAFNLGDKKWAGYLGDYYKGLKDYSKRDYYSSKGLILKYTTYTQYKAHVQLEEKRKKKITKKKYIRKSTKPRKQSAWMKAAIRNEQRRINAMYGTR